MAKFFTGDIVVSSSMQRALDDLTIVSFAQIAQGPLATQMLGDLGAEVIKIERPGGEWMREWSMANEYLEGQSTSFLSLNRNKRSVEFDLKDEDHRAVVYDVIDDADVVVENFRPGVMERLGFGYEELADRNPELVYASASGYGSSGPYSEKPGQDLLIQAESGMMSITGSRDDPPTPQAASIIDYFTGANLAFGILAALHYRDRTGEGQRIEADLFSAALALQSQELTLVTNASVDIDRGTEGIGHVFHQAPYGVYATADGHIAVSLTHPAELGSILDVDALEAVADWEEAYERRDEIYALLAETLVTESSSTWIERLSEHDVWCAQVRDIGDVEEHPIVDETDSLIEVDHPTAEPFTTPPLPLSFSKTPPTVDRHPPEPGEHTEEILEEYDQ
jgi:crotonobetainyl-CoA:carnitine CoA-transferase CaiB-like acyl-CoA transferase